MLRDECTCIVFMFTVNSHPYSHRKKNNCFKMFIFSIHTNVYKTLYFEK